MDSLSPEAIPNPMRAWAEALRGLDQDRMMQVVEHLAKAGDTLWESTPPEQRGEMLRDSMTVAKTYGGGLMAVPEAQDRPPSRAARNYLPELKAIALRLAEERKIRILVDPALFVSAAPVLPKASLSIDDALTSLAWGSDGLTWRRVHLAQPEAGLPDAAELSAEVRLFEGAGHEDLTAERGTPKGVALSRFRDPQQTRAMVERLGDDRRTVHLLYGATDHRGMAPSDRLADLQRRQMSRMVRMSPEAAAGTMANAIQSYRSAGTHTHRERIMALPVMAGMMAAWFPRAAKEGALNP
jgi:hypothetical protein